LEAIDRVSHDYEAIKETFPATATASVTAPLSVVSAEADAHDSGLVESEDEDFTPGEIVSDGLHPLDRTLTLTSPSDVVVTEPFILNDAQIVKSHMEQIKRRDDQVSTCFLGHFFELSKSDFERMRHYLIKSFKQFYHDAVPSMVSDCG
jgi:hypothetical protein